MYAMDGFATALGEITLVLFTTLAPAGALAYALMAGVLVFAGARIPAALRVKLDKLLSIPLVVAMVGLIASATHLGNPANALYVISGIGRSPLSNEVACGVLFLGSAGVFWLTSFAAKPLEGTRLALRRTLAALISLLGLLFVGAISLAYDAEPIITWHTPFAPATLWLNALIGGPLLALLGFRIAGFHTERHRLGMAYLGIAVVACTADVILYILWGVSLHGVANAIATADALVPGYGVMVAAFTALCASGIFLGAKAVMHARQTPLWVPIASTLCALTGIFIMRFAFYMTHMTAGLGV